MRRRPLEILNIAAILALAGVAGLCAAAGRLPGWPGVLERYGLMLVFLLVVSWLAAREEKLGRALRLVVNFYPMAIIPLLYESLGVLIPALRGESRDAWLVAADRAIFHADPTVWLERFVWPPLTDLLLLAYSTYYFFPIVVGVALWKKDRALARKFIFCLSFTFYLSYAGYFVIPAQGPRVALAAEQSVALEVTPVSRTISRKLNELEHTKDDAFPSGHTMVTVFCLLVAYRETRKVFRAWLPIALLLIVSTIYCRFHYVVDVIAGLSLAFLALPLGERLYGWIQGEFAVGILPENTKPL
ncbi:MAG TPA: phosphatase PAP2 family protein [Thermoanaerobaculia bacterium]|jgi:membrane-associated phospholipid phosphatase|nr:phosphatase PAP2 family protein [Thermoanaerobaculia bacterium]